MSRMVGRREPATRTDLPRFGGGTSPRREVPPDPVGNRAQRREAARLGITTRQAASDEGLDA